MSGPQSGKGVGSDVHARSGVDLIFIDSYLGPATIGHVAMVWDLTARQTIEALIPRRRDHRQLHTHGIFQIWRRQHLRWVKRRLNCCVDSREWEQPFRPPEPTLGQDPHLPSPITSF